MKSAFSALRARILRVLRPLRLRLRLEHGLEAVEYALIAALLSVIIVGAVQILQPQITAAYQAIADQLSGAAGTIGGGDG
ncbi:MAG TPA: Flp family type IVb pilin [Euzebyales bacterium]|nr:Flp family type IVb pilin [Euzebyales bacterium]